MPVIGVAPQLAGAETASQTANQAASLSDATRALAAAEATQPLDAHSPVSAAAAAAERTAAEAAADPDAEAPALTREPLTTGTGLDSAAYLKRYQIPVESYQTSVGARDEYPFSNAFDGDWTTTYMAPGTSEQAVFTITFKEPADLSKILYRHFNANQQGGFPTHFKLYASETGADDDYKLVADYQITDAERPSGPVVFSLAQPVKAKSIKFETLTSPAGVVAAEFKFLSYDQETVDVGNLFANDSQTVLNDAFDSQEALEKLDDGLRGHPNEETLRPLLDRAWKVYRGEIRNQNDRYDWPIHVIQKTGPDDQRINWVFLAEGYRADEMDKFKAQVTERVHQLLALTPYRDLANYMNIYAYCAESNDSGISYDVAGRKDSFFGCVHPSDEVGCSPGKGNAVTARKWIEDNYLENGAKLMHATLFVNDPIYFGSGGYTSVASYGGGAFMISHEAAHYFASLIDEYANMSYDGDLRGVNMTANADTATVRWREFLGFRGVGIRPQNPNTTEFTGYVPTYTCTMRTAYETRFCEVCRETVFRRLNDWLDKDKRPLYVAEPETTIHLSDEEMKAANYLPTVITEKNIAEAAGKQLEFRTVVSNYRDTDQQVTLRFTVTGADGAQKAQVEQTFTVAPNTQIPEGIEPNDSSDMRMAAAKSISVVTPAIANLAEGDKISGEVVYDGEVIKTDKANETGTYGTLKIGYKLVDDAGNVTGDLADVSPYEAKLYPGYDSAPAIPEIYGYTYVKSSQDEAAYEPRAGETVEITRYYRVSSVLVTRKLVDANGLVIDQKTARVASGETVTPAAGDFSASGDYQVVPPAPVTVGKDDVTLVYTLAPVTEIRNVARGKVGAVFKTEDGSPAQLNSAAARPISRATDGDISDSDLYMDFGAASDTKGSYFQLDLGTVYELGKPVDGVGTAAGDGSGTGSGEGSADGSGTVEIGRLWRYWLDARTYKGTIVMVSEDPTFSEDKRTIIFNSDTEGTDGYFGLGKGTDALYRESADGHGFTHNGVLRARYVRVYMHGSNMNINNHIVELELYGTRVADKNDNVGKLTAGISALQKKVESGLYTDESIVPAQNAIAAAQRLLYQGSVTDAALASQLEQLKAAESKLRDKDVSKGSIEFLGGSLRYSDNAATSLSGLRLGFRFSVPAGAKVDWDQTGWYFGLSAEGLGGSGKFQAASRHVEESTGSADGGASFDVYRSNIVFTDIKSKDYGAVLYARAKLVYTPAGSDEQVVIEAAAPGSRSVNGTASAILASDQASDAEKDLADDILGAGAGAIAGDGSGSGSVEAPASAA